MSFLNGEARLLQSHAISFLSPFMHLFMHARRSLHHNTFAENELKTCRRHSWKIKPFIVILSCKLDKCVNNCNKIDDDQAIDGMTAQLVQI
jgi:hypothetical protein